MYITLHSLYPWKELWNNKCEVFRWAKYINARLINIIKESLTSGKVSQCERCSKAGGWKTLGRVATIHTEALSDDPEGAHTKTGFRNLTATITWTLNPWGFCYRFTWRKTWVWMVVFTYKKVVNKPTATARPEKDKNDDRLAYVLAKLSFAHTILTESMLDDQFSTQYDEERKTLLEPADETAKFSQGGAGFSRVQIRVRWVELWFWTGVVQRPIMSMWMGVGVGVGVGVDSRPPGWCAPAGLPRCTRHGYPHLIAVRVGGSGTRGWSSGEKLWLQG